MRTYFLDGSEADTPFLDRKHINKKHEAENRQKFRHI